MTPNQPEGSYSTRFDWAIYADATLAGLAQLIPVPLVDSVVEDYFRNRMPLAIARRHNYPLPAAAVSALNDSRWTWDKFWQGCLVWPIRLTVDFFLGFIRKIVYFLTVKKAVDALNFYWQRAFLLDHMIRAGYLDDPNRLAVAVGALEQVLAQAKVSPLSRLARQLLTAPRRMAVGVWRAWRGQPAPALDDTRSTMARTWESFGGYFATLAQQYDAAYADLLTSGAAPV